MSEETEFMGISLRFDQRDVYVQDDEPDRFVYSFTGGILKLNIRDEDDIIGWFQASYVDVESAIEEGEHIPSVFDAAGQNELEYFEALYDDAGDVRPEVLDCLYGKFAAMWAPNLLVLERLEVLPAHRGKGVGLIALCGLMRVLGLGAGIVLMKPFPLQSEHKPRSAEGKARWAALHLDDLPRNRRNATAALRRYYRKLGFKLLRGTDFMVRDAKKRLPELESLMRTK